MRSSVAISWRKEAISIRRLSASSDCPASLSATIGPKPGNLSLSATVGPKPGNLSTAGRADAPGKRLGSGDECSTTSPGARSALRPGRTLSLNPLTGDRDRLGGVSGKPSPKPALPALADIGEPGASAPEGTPAAGAVVCGANADDISAASPAAAAGGAEAIPRLLAPPRARCIEEARP